MVLRDDRRPNIDTDLKEVLRLQNEALNSLRQSIDHLAASIASNKKSIDILHQRFLSLHTPKD